MNGFFEINNMKKYMKFVTLIMTAAIFFAVLSFQGGVPASAEVSLADQQDSYYWYQEARYYATNRKNYEKALECCNSSLKLNPDNAHAIELKSWLEERIRQLEEIKKKKLELTQKKQEEPEIKETAEVSASLSGEVELSSENEHLNNLEYYKGLTCLTEAKFDEAMLHFKGDLIENPDRIESWFYLFKYEKDNGNDAGALFYMKKLKEKIAAVGRDKIDAETLSNIYSQCMIYQDAAIIQKGIYMRNLDVDIKNQIKGDYNWKAISLIPDTSDILISRKMLNEINIEELKKSRVVPLNFSASRDDFIISLDGRVVSNVQSFKKKPKIEIPLMAQKIAVKLSEEVERMVQQGDYYAYIGVYDRALSFYDEALVRAPESPIANNNKGVMLKARGRFDEAIKCFEKAISYDKTYVEAYNNLATIYSERGNYDEALKLYVVAQKLNPVEAGIYYNIGVLYHKKGELDSARDYIAKAVEMNPSDPSYYYQLGLINLKKKNSKDAYSAFRKVSGMVPRNSDAYQKVVEILRTLTQE